MTMVDSNMEFVKENVRVDDKTFMDVEYRWEVFGDRVDVIIRYSDSQTETSSFWPSDPLVDAAHALDIVRMCAALKHIEIQRMSD